MGTPKRLSVDETERGLIRLALKTLFQNLNDDGFRPESEATDEYNCVAWAFGDVERKWWPTPDPADAFWPLSWREEVTDCFIEMFREVGSYELSNSDVGHEPGFEKIALYLDTDHAFTHVARQLPDGTWTSKLGNSWDIVHHEASGIENSVYGNIRHVMRRKIP